MTTCLNLSCTLFALALCACATAGHQEQQPQQAVATERALPKKKPDSAASPSQPRATLYQRLGGMPAIEGVVKEFRKNVNEDERVNALFGVADMELLHRHLVEYFCEVTGGPCKYTGRDMKSDHKGMGITNAQFDAVVQDLVKSLDKFHVPTAEKSEILGALGPLRGQIVEQ